MFILAAHDFAFSCTCEVLWET